MSFDYSYFYELAKDILTTPSPSGYTHIVIDKIKNYADELGLKSFKTNKGNLIVEFEGEDSNKTLALSAHVDTLGLMVRSINSDGTLAITSIGGNQMMTLQGEYCKVHTRDQKTYTGTILSTSPSSHVYEDCARKGQTADELMIRLDEVVHSKDDALALGIQNGDFISIDPKTTITDSGFIKSRHIDDKAMVAAVIDVLRQLKEENLKPAYDTLFAFPIYEEIGHGGAYVPSEVSEYVALDIGLIGPDNHGSEKKVSIGASDNYSPYDWGLTTKIINLAKANNINYCVDTYYRFGSDATAAIRAGNNIMPAVFGVGCMNSHGYERTSIQAIEDCARLTLAYVLSE